MPRCWECFYSGIREGSCVGVFGYSSILHSLLGAHPPSNINPSVASYTYGGRYGVDVEGGCRK